jgi:hypothetical protein
MKLLIIILSILTLTGCAATGPFYHEHQANVVTLNNSTSRVYFFRNPRFVSKAVDAEIYINNNKVGECANNAYFFVDIKPGKTMLKVENTIAPGTHKLEKELEGGNEYYYEILVNESYVNAGIILGLIGQGTYVASNDNVSGWIFKETPKTKAIHFLRNKVFSLDGQ